MLNIQQLFIKKLAPPAFFLALFFFQVPALCAQVQLAGSLVRQVKVAPGNETQGRIIVSNPSDQAQTAKVYLTDYQSFADGTTRYGEAGLQPRSNAAWVHLIPREQVVPPRGTASFHYIIRVPEHELTGTYWSMLMVEPVASEKLAPPAPAGRSQVGIRTITRTGVHLVTHIGDSGERDLRFISRRLEQEEDRLALLLELENTGQRYLNLLVWAELFAQDGTSLGRFDAGRRGLYPGSSARLRADLAGVPPGAYQALVVADNGDEHIFGARFEMNIPGPDKSP